MSTACAVARPRAKLRTKSNYARLPRPFRLRIVINHGPKIARCCCKLAVEAFVPGSVPFPGPLTPARARANAIVRAVYGFSAQQQAVVWRRAKNLQVYMA